MLLMGYGLVKVSGRPSHVVIDGWTLFVSLHDGFYCAERSRWRVRVARCHPDAGGSAWRFRRMQTRYRRWLREEARWYALVGLEPPPWGARLAFKTAV